MSTVAKRYQDGSYASQNPGLGDANAVWKAGHILGMIRRQGIPHRTVAEVGCAGGAILAHLQRELEEDVRFTGYEPMPEGYAKALASTNARLGFQNCGIDELTGLHFDLVLCIDVFEHVEDYFAFLRKLATLGDHFIGYSQNFLGFCAWPEIALRRRAEVGQGKIRHNSHRASRCSAFGTYSVFASTHLAGRQGDL